MYAALEWFTTHDHEREYQERIEQARVMQADLEEREDTYRVLFADPERYPAWLLGVQPKSGAWDPDRSSPI